MKSPDRWFRVGAALVFGSGAAQVFTESLFVLRVLMSLMLVGTLLMSKGVESSPRRKDVSDFETWLHHNELVDPTNRTNRVSDHNDCAHTPALSCKHKNVERNTLYGGDGPDEAAEAWSCHDCGAYAWKYCDGTVSAWRPPLKANT